jgi:hypothetical protein
MSSRKPSSS